MKYKQSQFDEELRKMLKQSGEDGKKCLRIVSKQLHDSVVSKGDNRMVTACGAMWELWKEQGSRNSRIIHSTPSGKSSTIQIEFDTNW